MPTHTRIRMFNTKETYPNQALNNDVPGGAAGNTVYVRGRWHRLRRQSDWPRRPAGAGGAGNEEC